jgi:putative ABC transport system substrate-binding protein
MAIHIRRREFIVTLGGAAAAWPLGVRAQQGERMRRIGFLSAAPETQEMTANTGAFRRALQELGWTDGRNVRIEMRWSGAKPEVSRTFAACLVMLNEQTLECHQLRQV